MIYYQSVDQSIVSFYNLGSATVGCPCALTTSGHIADAASGADFIGVVHSVRSHMTGVILGGCVTLPYSGSTEPSLGWCGLAADGSGGVTVNAEKHSHLVLDIDRDKKTVTIYL